MANGATPYNALPNAKVRELILAGEKNVFPKGSDPEGKHVSDFFMFFLVEIFNGESINGF